MNATYDADFGKYLRYIRGASHTDGIVSMEHRGQMLTPQKTSAFTINKPLKKGEKIKIDMKTLAEDALAGASGVMRFAIRPKANSYGITESAAEVPRK